MRGWKRLVILALCLLMAAWLPVTAKAKTTEEQLMSNITRIYQKTLNATGKEQMHGYCGTMVGYFLYFMGISKTLIAVNGNKQYDSYCYLKETTGGYRVNTYPGSEYTLEEALRAITKDGTQDVFNILVGFEWSSTEAGNLYGHAVVIHGIIDGIVYFTESFDIYGRREGEPVRCSIADFVRYYDSWTRLDGVIHFTQKEYADNCTDYITDLYVSAETETGLYSQPLLPGTDEAYEVECLRPVAAGERLRATGVYENLNGEFFYRVDEEDRAGYLPAGDAVCLRVNLEGVTATDVLAPETLLQGKGFAPGGTVTIYGAEPQGVRVRVTDAENEAVMSYTLTGSGRTFRLSNKNLNKAMRFSALTPGTYTYSVEADVCYYDVRDGQLVALTETVSLWRSDFRVIGKGEETPPTTEPGEAAPEALRFPDGWSCDGQTWYYYENGEPRTGWFRDQGINYYLKFDGSVTTGQAEINGQIRYFTQTGALRTGWVTTGEDSFFLLSNGVAARGWRTVDGEQYYFEEETGVMVAGDWLDHGDSRYYLQEDGSAATGWITLEEGSFCFREDGSLLAQAVEQDGKTYYQPYGITADTVVNISLPSAPIP